MSPVLPWGSVSLIQVNLNHQNIISQQPKSYHTTCTTEETKLRSRRFFFLIRLGNNRFLPSRDETKVPQGKLGNNKQKKRKRLQAPGKPGAAKGKKKRKYMGGRGGGLHQSKSPNNAANLASAMDIYRLADGNSSTQNEPAPRQ